MAGLGNTLANVHDAAHKIDPLDKALNKAVLGTDNPWRAPDYGDPAAARRAATSIEDDGTGKATSTSTTLYGDGLSYNGNEKLRTQTKSADSTANLLGG